jgi:hypothetical protein
LDDTAFPFIELNERRDRHFAAPLAALASRVIALRDGAENAFGLDPGFVHTDAALGHYEAARRPPTAKIVLANRQNGPEQVMQMAEDRAPGGFGTIDTVISRAELEEVAARYKLMAGFDKDELNHRPSLSISKRRGAVNR